MSKDIVLDTNIFLHACDERQDHRESCEVLLTFLEQSEISICIDTGYSSVESDNRSKIGSEYHNFLVPDTIGFIVVAILAQNKRIKEISTKVNSATGKLIRRLVLDPTDRCFVKVAHNSSNKTLVSHDFAAMPASSRTALRTSLEVLILGAAEARTELGA